MNHQTGAIQGVSPQSGQPLMYINQMNQSQSNLQPPGLMVTPGMSHYGPPSPYLIHGKCTQRTAAIDRKSLQHELLKNYVGLPHLM